MKMEPNENKNKESYLQGNAINNAKQKQTWSRKNLSRDKTEMKMSRYHREKVKTLIKPMGYHVFQEDGNTGPTKSHMRHFFWISKQIFQT